MGIAGFSHSRQTSTWSSTQEWIRESSKCSRNRWYSKKWSVRVIGTERKDDEFFCLCGISDSLCSQGARNRYNGETDSQDVLLFATVVGNLDISLGIVVRRSAQSPRWILDQRSQ